MIQDTANDRVPVTVLTGFLGSGKTTLLNRILSENHGKRIAVIENEFGEIGVDQELVIGAEEEIFEMNNGCICCTVRGDLIRILGNLMKRRDRFDYIMVETTGMADPGPVAQTFFVDDEMKEKLRLDGIVTVVDALHVWQHFDQTDEVREQIAFADVILLNKIDLVTPEILDKLEARVREMNAAAKIHRTRSAEIDVARVLNVGGFNLERAIEVDPKFMEPEYPFEWAGIYRLEPGTYPLRLGTGPDPSMKLALLPVSKPGQKGLESVLLDAVLLFSDKSDGVRSGDGLTPGKRLYALELEGEAIFHVTIRAAGFYALFTQHRPEEFDAALHGPAGVLEPTLAQEFKPDHAHDDAVTSVGITLPGDVDPGRLNEWLGELLRTRGTDIFRMKGVLSVKGSPERFVFQGVHMLFEGRPDRLWGARERHNALIFIGRNLNRAELVEGFRRCLA